MAIFWLFLGLGMVVLHWLYLNVRQGRMFSTLDSPGLSMGWIAILLSVYNLVRWWGLRSAVAHRRAVVEEYERRLRALERERRRPEQELDPNFNFTDSPPQREAGGREDHP
jgi:hypothetical protein